MVKEKVQIPDGGGGYSEVEADRVDGQQADANRQNEQLQKEAQKAHWTRVGKGAEAFNKFHKAYATDFSLTEEELIKVMYLEILNWKEFYPEDLGGSQRFDELCKEAWAWFEENK